MADLIAELEGVVQIESAARFLASEGEVKQTAQLRRLFQSKAATFLSAHHAEIAAAVRDARGERSESWEVWQDDMPVAGSDSIADAKHYLMMYGQDGPVKLVRKVGYRETVTPEQIAAMRAGEGQG